VAYALALRANPNVVDRSRGTHSIFLALAAADPGVSSATSVIPGSVGRQSETPSATRKAFPIAELLMLNGAELPTNPPPIPLSRAGQDYLTAKLEQRSGRRTTVAAPTTGLGASNSTINHVLSGDSRPGNNGDTITALPSIGNSIGNTGSPDGRRKRLSSGGLGNKLQKASGPPG